MVVMSCSAEVCALSASLVIAVIIALIEQLTVALDGVWILGLFSHMVVPLRGSLIQSQEDKENTRYPQVHLVKLNLQI